MEQLAIKQIITQNYNLINILFKDDNKQIYLAQNKNNKERVIIKEINVSNLNEKEREMSLQEGIILSKLKHPNIINCYGFYYEKDKIIILIKYEEGGDLKKKLKIKKINILKKKK